MTTSSPVRRAAVDNVPPPSRAVRVAAGLVPLCVLPSAVWRLAGVVRHGNPHGCPANFMGGWEPLYIGSLSVVSLGAALLTLGLVQRWGLVFPSWLPGLGGRAVPARPVVVAAAVEAGLVWTVLAWMLLNNAFDWYRPVTSGCESPFSRDGAGVALAAYLPLVLWAPLLTLVLVDHRRRRAVGDRARD